MACMADYSEEDLKLMKSVREETIKEIFKKLEKCRVTNNSWCPPYIYVTDLTDVKNLKKKMLK